MIAFGEVTIGTGGVARCVRCGPAVPVARGLESVRADVEALATDWSTGPGPNVVFTGFEPFAHPHLPALVEAAVSAGCQRVRLRTDAGALATPGNAEGALAAGVRQLEVVVLGDRATHDGATARQGLFDAALAGIAAFLEAAERVGEPVAVTGLVPVCPHTLAAAPAAAAVLAAAGAVAVVFDVSACSTNTLAPVHAGLETATVRGMSASVVGAPQGAVQDVVAAMPWTVLGSSR